jgi:hypothetical protein
MLKTKLKEIMKTENIDENELKKKLKQKIISK